MTPDDYMRRALELFAIDPPDTDFQEGYMEALKVFANEAMGFKWDDPLLWGSLPPTTQKVKRPAFTVIDGGANGEPNNG